MVGRTKCQRLDYMDEIYKKNEKELKKKGTQSLDLVTFTCVTDYEKKRKRKGDEKEERKREKKLDLELEHQERKKIKINIVTTLIR